MNITELDKASAVLDCEGLSVRFGGLHAIRNLNLKIKENSIHALIGPNGAGKTTFVNCLTGFVPPASGHVYFRQKEVLGLKPNQIAALGIARTFQNVRLFSGMSILENVLVGAHLRFRSSFLRLIFRRHLAKHEEKELLHAAETALAFAGLRTSYDRLPVSLPYGHQRRLEIARALVSEPHMVLLDEPMAGMNPHEKSDLVGLIQRIRARNVTVLLIEHDVAAVKVLADRVTVLHHGEMIADDEPGKVFSDPAVDRAYLARSVS